MAQCTAIAIYGPGGHALVGCTLSRPFTSRACTQPFSLPLVPHVYTSHMDGSAFVTLDHTILVVAWWCQLHQSWDGYAMPAPICVAYKPGTVIVQFDNLSGTKPWSDQTEMSATS